MPRPLRVIGIPVVGLLLVLFFVLRGLPYERLSDVAAARASRALGARVEVAETGPWLTLRGLGLEARGVRVVWSDGRRIALERAAVRPAWSVTWLRAQPAFYAELGGPGGEFDGIWVPRRAWAGELRGLDLALLPRDALWPGLESRGRLDASVDLRFAKARPEGEVRFEANSGSLTLPGAPMPLPFNRLSGELVFGGEGWLTIGSLAVEGPLLSGDGQGRVGPADAFADGPLDLEFQVRSSRSNVRGLLRSAGARVGRGGATRLRIRGTPRAPSLR